MSYSTIADRVDKQGHKSTMTEIYRQYKAAKARMEEAEQVAKAARGDVDALMSDAHNLVYKACQSGTSIVEDEFHVLRTVIEGEVVHFRIDGEKIFIGYWPLSKFIAPKG